MSAIVVISNVSIKNNVVTLILYVYSNFNDIKKTIYYTINIILTKTELFAIRYGINQAVQISKVSHITVITDTIYSVRHIFNLITHFYQIQLIAIAQDLRAFFNKHTQNSINF